MDAPCSVLIRRRGVYLTVAVSDPTQAGGTVTVSYEGRVLTKVDLTGTRGASQVTTIKSR
ncbi:polysaccharide lyase beta-sandwich domain-containing protein [Kutzneria buriramensis]|uniref:Polysaccharide lyase family 8-like protein n=1 Tax=Kutzneria buriramensis TaxID=1045776 RepID=A0A3E0H7L1_9PSEU|nr:polysaccharide lyase beta-sandwich domain-containing protein [Kutzneria buriramensis]REH39441.1 polysaccharide lyase family 8-like protein [Kutzneria buriramensis]